MRRRIWFRCVIAAISVLVAAVVAGALFLYHHFLGGYQTDSFLYAGVERSLGFILPHSSGGDQKRPLLVLLHGMGMSPRDMALVTAADCRPAANANRCVLVYPSGIDGRWNDKADDSAFLAALIDHCVTRFKGDSNRVYVLGMSNGAQMAYRLVCDHPERITAAASLLGLMDAKSAQTLTNRVPIPILILNSTRDPIVKWDGGPVGIGSESPPLVLLSGDQNLAFWTNRNNAGQGPEVVAYPDIVPGDGSQVVRHAFRGDADVVLLKVVGADHSTPTKHWRPWNTPGTNRDMDAISEAVDFLFRFTRNQSGGVVEID